MKIIKKVILVLSGLVFLILLSVIIILKYFENEIYKIVLIQINKNINTEISSNRTKLLLFQYFPNAALSFYNVKIDINKSFSLAKVDTFKSNNFISADQLTVKFSLFSLLKNPIIIKGIEIKNGSISILENLYNNNNYQLTNNLSKNSKALIFQVQKLQMRHIYFRYFNEKNDFYLNTYIKSLDIHGKIQNNYSSFKTIASLNYIYISYKSSKYSTKYTSNASFIFTSKPEIIILTDGFLSINNELFKFKGSYLLSNSNRYNFTIQTHKLNFTSIHKFNINIPKEISLANGNFSIYFNFFGKNEKNSPFYFYTISSINNLSFQYKKYKFNNINFNLHANGTYFNTLKAILYAKEIKGDFLNSDFSLTCLKYETSTDSISGKGSINIKFFDLKNLVNDTFIKITDGKIRLSFVLKSRIENNIKNNLLIILKNSKISISKLNCSLFKDKYSLVNFNSEIFTSDNNLKFSYLNGIINKNRINFVGNISNYQSLFIDSCNKIEINGMLNGKFLNLNDIITDNKSIDSDNSFKHRKFSIFVDLNINYDTVIFKNFTFGNYRSIYHYSNGTYFFSNINTTFCGGKISDGILKIYTDSNFLSLTTNCNFKLIDIETLFSRFRDFGQNEITSKIIKGKLSGNTNCKISWKDNIFLKENFLGNISFELINGQLDGFRPIYKLSKYIDISELNNIKFKKLTNKITISNKIVNIPIMNLDNSALNLSMSGSHSFENEYEYHFKVILSNFILKKQVNKVTKKGDYFQTEKDTLRTIYLKLVGNNSSYKFTYDGKLALKAFSDKIDIEKNRFKKIFNEEFGLFKNDSSIRNNTNKLKNKTIIESEEIRIDKNQIEIEKQRKKEKVKNEIEWKDE